MRVVVIGSSGSGKTTFARKLAQACDLQHVELDALNWGPGWTDRSRAEPEQFVADVDAAAAGDRWVSCGNYGVALKRLLPRATHLVWLDFPRPLIMARVIRRSVLRAASRKELWPGTGNFEHVGRWLDKGHPIRWAWDTFHRRRAQYELLFAQPELAHLETLRLTAPRQAEALIARLAARALVD